MSLRSTNPHQPSDIVVKFDPAGADGVKRSVSRSCAAFSEWSRQPAVVRGGALTSIASALEARSEEIVNLVIREVGKPISEARAELVRSVAIFRYYAQMVLMPDGETYPTPDGQSKLMVSRYPIGPCALITPWNFPVAIPTWKAAPALAYGNSIVLKPAPASTAVALLFQEIASQHLPHGVFEIVVGSSETGEALVEHPGIAVVSFTGSTTVGGLIARRAAERGARYQCEMGGQNPSVVLADGDLKLATSSIAYAAMGYAGQKCTATRRVIVEDEVYDEMRERLVAAIGELKVTDPRNEECQVGPLIDDSARAAALDALREADGTVLVGGKALDDGFYLTPSLVEIDDPRQPLAQEEVFAPIATLLRAGSADEALQISNGVRYGLVGSVFTSDLAQGILLASRLEAGMVRINAPTSGVEFHVPFGGSKSSSIGPREQGVAARDFFTETRTILISP